MSRVAARTQRGSQERILMTRRTSYQRGNVQLHNGEWTLRYREYNHATRKWTTKREKLGKFRDKKAARRAAEPIMVRVNERNNSDRPPEKVVDLTFRQFVEGRWKSYCMSAKHQPSTSYAYNSLLSAHLFPRFGDKRLVDVAPVDISEFLEEVEGKRSASTVHVLYTLLRQIFDLAEQLDIIERSPVRSRLHRPEITRIDKPTLSVTQIGEILRNMDSEQERLFVLLLAVTGMRMGEGLALRWMDFKADRLQINHTLYRGRIKSPKTDSSRRHVRLAPAVAEAILMHKAHSQFQADTDFLFCRPDGLPLVPTVVRTHLYKAMDRAGIKRRAREFGFHIFRHTAGTLLYARSRDLKLVQGTLGHSQISTTSDVYVHLDPSIVGEGAEILAEEILAKCDLTVTQRSKMVS